MRIDMDTYDVVAATSTFVILTALVIWSCGLPSRGLSSRSSLPQSGAQAGIHRACGAHYLLHAESQDRGQDDSLQ